jgi:hypothetical protein
MQSTLYIIIHNSKNNDKNYSLAVLEFELRASHLVDKCFAT